MGLYIPDLRLPIDGDFELWIAVKKDGSFTYNVRGSWQDGKQKAILVLPHGKLIDVDMLEKLLSEELLSNDKKHLESTWNDAVAVVFTAPTIIPAEEGE